MISQYARVYRDILRELSKAAVAPRKLNKVVASNFRVIVEKSQESNNARIFQDVQNALLFLRSQREHKLLLDRYNPLFDLTAEERIHATARRVGLDMPITHAQKAYHVQVDNFFQNRADPTHDSTNSNSDEPEISSPETLAAIKTASHHLVDLLQPVAFPTETVYGLGAVAHDSDAASRIFSTKGRPPDNPLIVHVSSLAMLNTLLPADYLMSRAYKALIKHFWPGALTLLFPRSPNSIPSIITADQPTVAIRMPSHTVARALIATAKVPIAAPSANSSGKPSPTRSEHVLRDLNGKISIILDGGACGVGLESTVVDGLSEDGNIRILRPGGVTVEDLERVLRQELSDCSHIPRVLVHRRDYLDEAIEQAPTTPGMKYRHYSPSVPVTLLLTQSRPPPDVNPTPISSLLASLKKSKIGVLAPADSTLWNYLTAADGIRWCKYPLGLISEPSVTAFRLFDGLLTLERDGVDCILIQEIEEDREGLAIMNRVRKAAGDSRWVVLE